MQPLTGAIRKDDDFPVIVAGGEVHKFMLYADDILLFVSDPGRSIHCLLRIIGYRVNWSKLKALALTAF